MESKKVVAPAVLVTVALAGFLILGQSDGGDRLQDSTCSEVDIQLNHYQGEKERTRFIYDNDTEIEKIEAEWVFSDGNITREVLLEENEYTSGKHYTVVELEAEGDFSYLVARPAGCPQKTFRFPSG